VIRAVCPPGAGGALGVRTITRLRDGSLFAVDTKSFLEWRLFVYGDYEFDVQGVLRRYLRPDDNAVDVGANIGVHTVAMAKAVGRNGRVLAVEPFGVASEKLRGNLQLNGFANVVVESVAAGSRSGEASFFPPRADALDEGQGSMLALDYLEAEPERVEVATLDALIERSRVSPVRLVKIDVEGAETEVLAGMQRTIECDRPYLLLEYSPEHQAAAGVDWDGFLHRICDGYRYSLYRVARRNRLERLGPRSPSSTCVVLAMP
jgi:FkbM family methyltransferase